VFGLDANRVRRSERFCGYLYDLRISAYFVRVSAYFVPQFELPTPEK
jgi:hypothetical protein